MLKRKIALLGLIGILGLASCGTEMEYVAGTADSSGTNGGNRKKEPFVEETVEGNLFTATTEYTAPSEEYNSTSDNFSSYTAKLNSFSGNIAAQLLAENEHNTAVSPLSIYMALAMTSSIGSGDTSSEILNALGMTDDEIKNYVSALMYYANSKSNKTLTEILANSIWLNSNLEYKEDALTELANYYNASSYQADFTNDNYNANCNITKYVKNNTKGLINQNFNLNSDTAFALINTLYYKDAWEGVDTGLALTDEAYTFTDTSGHTRDINLIQGNYADGQTIVKDTYSAFYAETYNGYHLTFVVPNDDYSLSSVFTADTISYVNSSEFKEEVANTKYDSTANTYYMTRCLFPTFRAEYHGSIVSSLYNLGISTAFTESADFKSLTDTQTKLTDVIHATKLKVDTEGIEGAAVTMGIASITSVEPERTIVYNDFIINKAFGYVISYSNGIPLFTGMINEI